MRIFSSAEYLLNILGDDEGTHSCDRKTISLSGMSSSVSQQVAVVMIVSLSIPVLKRVGPKANGASVPT